MAWIPTTRFGFPSRLPRDRGTRTEIFQPTRGVHSGEPLEDLPPGFTPESRNVVTDQGYLERRSALSQYGGFSAGQPVLGGGELPDVSGALSAVASSASSIFYIHPSTDSWSELSYIQGTVALSSDDTLSGLSVDYFSVEPIYDAQSDEFIAVLSNGTNFAKFFTINSDVTTYSDYTWPWSLDSTKAAEAVGAINDRLVLFNTISSNGTKFPTRVLWSARGNPRDYTLDGGAGFEDLMGMRGEGQAIRRLKDSLILFTDEEVWVAQPTLDDYAFRFQRVSDRLGCPYPRTAQSTPLGVIFLSQDLEVYVTDGFRVEALGPVQAGGPSRIQHTLELEMIEGDRAWSVYNSSERRYELYYTTNETTDGYPVRAFYFSLTDGSWFQQTFSHELSFGFDLKNTGTSVTWDSLDGLTWDEMNAGWDSIGAVADDRRIVAFGSAGTAYRFLSDVTNDDGSDLDCRWRSHGLNQDNQMRQAALYRLWMDFDTTAPSTISIYTSSDRGASFTARTSRSISPTDKNTLISLYERAQSPLFEIRWVDGSPIRIGRFQAELRDAGAFPGGG